MAYDLKPNRIDRSIEEAESLMTCLGNGYPGLRGPYLAKLEICYRMKEGLPMYIKKFFLSKNNLYFSSSSLHTYLLVLNIFVYV